MEQTNYDAKPEVKEITMSEKDKRACSLVKKFYEDWKSDTEQLREKWKGIQGMAWFFKALNQIEPQNKTLINKCFENIQSVLPRIYGKRPKYELYARQGVEGDKVAMAKSLVEYQWDDYEMDEAFYEAGNWFLTYGSHVWFVGTDLKVFGKTKKKGKKIEIEPYVARDTQGILQIPVWDWIINPKDKDLQKAPGVAYRESDILIKDLEDCGLYDKEAVAQIPRSAGVVTTDHTDQDDLISEKHGVDGVSLQGIEMVDEVIHFYGLFKCEPKDPPEEYIITIAGSAGRYVTIQCEPNFFEDEKKNPYRPFVDFHDQKDPHMFYSVGEVEQVMGLQAVLNTFLRQRIDAVRKSLRNKWLIEEGSIIDETSIYTDADNAIIEYSKNAKNLPEPVKFNDITGGLYQDIQYIVSEINNVSGVTDFTKGAESPSSQTATASALSAEAGNMRFKMKLNNLYRSIKKYIRIRLNQNAQFMSKKQKVRIWEKGNMVEKDVEPFPVADVDIIIEEGSTQLKNSIAEQDRAQKIMAILAQFQQMGPDAVKADPFSTFAFVTALESLNVTDPYRMLGIDDDPEKDDNEIDNARLADKQAQVDRIDQENKAISQDQPIEVDPSDDHSLHLKAHSDFLASPMATKLSDEQQEALYLHMIEHEQYRRNTPTSDSGSTAPNRGAPQESNIPSAEQGVPMDQGASVEQVPPSEGDMLEQQPVGSEMPM